MPVAGRRVAERQCSKILLTGTHSTGKTTLALALAEQLCEATSYVVTEPARDCPFLLNSSQNDLSTMWLLASQIRTEIEAQTCPGAALVICDRGVPDIIAHHQIAGGSDSVSLAALAADWVRTYDHIFVARPDPAVVMAPDPLRVEDPRFRLGVQLAVEQWLNDTCAAFEVLPHAVADRIKCICAHLRPQPAASP